MVQPWQNDDLSRSLSSFDGFCDLLGMGRVQYYISARGLHRVQDWSSCPLDEEGKILQVQMQQALEVCELLLENG